MLSLIRIRNFAVVDEVEVEFDRGLSVMTGETGAGKSILVDALGLALGDRADAGAVRHGTDKAEISVLFECPEGHASLAWLDEHGLDDERNCSLRRVISAEGRSRAFVNNHPVKLQDLRELGSLLVDIHGQHAHQSLLAPGEQRRLLDAYAELEDTTEQVGSQFRQWQALVEQIAVRRSSAADREAQLELLRFQIHELEELGLGEGEYEEIDSQMRRLAHVEQLAEGVQAAVTGIDEADDGATARSIVSRAARELAALGRHDKSLAEIAERLGALEIELDDIASTLAHYRDTLEPDPARLALLESRTARARALALRHGVEEAALFAVQDALQKKLEDLGGGSGSLEALQREVQSARETYFTLAGKLSKSRKKAARALATAVTGQMAQLGLDDGRFEISIEARPQERAGASGIDDVEFEVSLNAGQPCAPLGKVASGGELSRISLAVEVVSAADSAIPSFVFDEVDAGIGGRVAEIVGSHLAEIAQHRQVLCVTHLPQVASKGATHYRVVKLSDGKTTRTQVHKLSQEARIDELARMLGGIEITQRTRDHAEEMISRAAK